MILEKYAISALLASRSLTHTMFDFANLSVSSFKSTKLQRKEEEEYTANARWAVFCTSFSFAVAGVVVIMHMISSLSHYIIGTKIEGFLTVVLLAFWSTTVAVGALRYVALLYFTFSW